MILRLSPIKAIPSGFKEDTLRKRIELVRYMAEDVIQMITEAEYGTIHFPIVHQIPASIFIKPRHRVIAARPKCVFCDLPVSVAILEKWMKDSVWHLHFYGLRGGMLALFNIDHIVPRSLGGSDDIRNYQTTCQYCNSKKGDICTDPFAAAQIRLRGRHG